MSGWSQQPWSQSSSIFNMNPLDLISNFMSPVLDIVSPLEDIRNLMSQGARMYGPSVLPKIVQQKQRKGKTMQGGQLLPQKYRIVIDCKGIVEPNSLKTNIKCVQDCKHLIVMSDVKKGRQLFKRSYTLPVECETKKMTKFVTPQQQLVIEFNYMDVPLSLAISPEHEICTTPEHGKCVHVRVPIADFVEPAKVKVHVKARDLFVHFEERIVPHGDFCSRVIYHTRVQLPRNVDLNGITAKSDKHKLTILAPIGVKSKGGVSAPISQQLRDIAVKRKLRHRKARAVSVGAEQKQQQQVPSVVTDQKKKQVQPSISDKQKKTPLDTSTTTPISGQQQQQQPLISKKKQKKQSLLDKPDQKPSISKPTDVTPSISKPTDVTPSISKPTDVTSSISDQKPSLDVDKKPAQQLPGVTSEEKKKKKKKSKKLTATSTSSAMPTGATDTPTMSSTSTFQDQNKDVPSSSSSSVDVGKVGDVGAHDITSPVDVGSRNIGDQGQQDTNRPTQKGSDILKNIFGDMSSSQQQQGSQSTTSTTQSPDLSSSDKSVPDQSGSPITL